MLFIIICIVAFIIIGCIFINKPNGEAGILISYIILELIFGAKVGFNLGAWALVSIPIFILFICMIGSIDKYKAQRYLAEKYDEEHSKHR